LEPRRGVRVA